MIRRRWGKIPVRGVSGSLLLQAASKMVTEIKTPLVFLKTTSIFREW